MESVWEEKKRVHENCNNQLITFPDIVAEDPCTPSSVFIPVISSSHKTTVSVVTGHQEYHPVYKSPGNFINTAC